MPEAFEVEDKALRTASKGGCCSSPGIGGIGTMGMWSGGAALVFTAAVLSVTLTLPEGDRNSVCGACAAKLDGTCVDAGPQSPRDVTVGSTGTMASDKTPLTSLDGMVHVNTHFHLGAEHRSAGEYDEPMNFGFGCKTATDSLAAKHLAAYDFQYCKDTEVGQTYEFHWVYSTGGEALGAGLGGAFATTSEPTIIVQGQVFVVVNDDTGAYDKNLLDGSTFAGLSRDIAMYMGSTTGSSYNNYDKCSPYSINWHVDRKCHLVSAKSLDEVCRQMIELGLKDDTHPHESRELVGTNLSVDTLL